MTVQDKYSYWQAALKGQSPAYHDDTPQAGFYRCRNQDGGFDPIAIWFEGDDVVCKRGTKIVDADRVADIWRHCAQRPVAHNTYVEVCNGGEWPDVVKAPEIGHNSGDASLASQYREGVSEKFAEFTKWLKSIGGKIDTRDQADRADAFRGVIAKLRTDGEKERVKEKEPHLAAGRAVDAAWRPVADDATKAEKKIRDAITPYLNEADRQRRIAEEAAREALAADRARSTENHVPEPPPPEFTEPPKVGNGRGTRLVDVKTPIITDFDKVKAAFAKTTIYEDMAREWALKNAVKLADAGAPIDGVEIKTSKEAK